MCSVPSDCYPPTALFNRFQRPLNFFSLFLKLYLSHFSHSHPLKFPTCFLLLFPHASSIFFSCLYFCFVIFLHRKNWFFNFYISSETFGYNFHLLFGNILHSWRFVCYFPYLLLNNIGVKNVSIPFINLQFRFS